MQAFTKQQLIREIEQLPEEHLDEVYRIILSIKHIIQGQEDNRSKIMALAGSWSDMTEKDFMEFLEDTGKMRDTFFEERE